MSLHAQLTQEARQRLEIQQRRSKIASMVLSFMVVALTGAVLALFAIESILQETPTIITYSAALREDNEVQQRKVSQSIQRKPAAPSAAMAKVIAANTASPTAVPVPDVNVATPSMEFGDGDDFGSGWGGDDGFAEGTASFFGQQTSARRIAYVIDYSMSMRGRRDQLMRAELSRSISTLPPGVDYQIIFFAGPAWVAGDTVEMAGDRRTAEVKSAGRTFRWESARAGASGWQTRGARQRPDWLKVTESNREQSLAHIRDTPLVWGTIWEPPLDMALNLDPRPDVIYFMTDGVVGGTDPVEVARRIANRARTRNVVINTVAMMEPRAERAMIEMATRTGGVASMIQSDGQAVVLGGGDD